MTRRGIALVPDGALAVTQNDPEFSPLVADTLGDNLTDSDGWDNDIAALASLFDGGDDLLSAMEQHIADADFTDGDIDSGLLQPVADSTAQLITDGAPLFDKMVTDAQPPSSGGGGPTPPPPPPGGPPNPPPKCPAPPCSICPPFEIPQPDGSCGPPEVD